MSDSNIAILLSSILSLLLAFIQITTDAKTSDVRGLLTLSFVFYALIVIFGNIITTLASASIIDNYFSVSYDSVGGNQIILSEPTWIWYSTFGVFGFEAIIQKINITFFDQGVLSINDWLTKAKKSATAATLDKIVNLEIQDAKKLALGLIRTKDSASIHTFASIKLGTSEYQNLIKSIGNTPNLDSDKYLAYLLAEQFPKETKAEIKAK